MTITASLPAVMPNRLMQRQELITAVDALYAALPEFATQIDAVVAAFNFNSTNSTSTTSLAIAIASKSLTVQTSKSYVPGQAVTIARTSDATKWMRGEVTSYDSGTGALVVNARTMSSVGGTFTDWTISQAAVEGLVADNVVTVHTGNGHGSTNTKRRRFQTTKEATGTDITYADSATLGGSFTANGTGLYEIYYYDSYSGGRASFGITVNNSQGSTTITTVTGSERLLMTSSSTVGGVPVAVCRTIKLIAGDVFYAHTDGTPDTTTEAQTYLSVRKVAVI